LSAREDILYPELKNALKDTSNNLNQFKAEYEKGLEPKKIKSAYEKFNELYRNLENNTKILKSIASLQIILKKGISDMKKSSHLRKILFKDKKDLEINSC
jgi:hypothetical protein